MRRFIEADAELVGYFTSSVGVRAQSYDSDGGGGGAFDSERAHEGMLRECSRGTMHRVDAVAATLRLLTPAHRRVLQLVYEPHAPGTNGLKLASDLTPSWGGGSFVRLSALTETARAAFDRRFHREGDPAAVLVFLRDEAGRGRQSEGLFRRLREECETARERPLEAYDALREHREHAEGLERRRRRAESERRGDILLAQILGRKARRETLRFEQRLGKVPT